MQDKIVYFEFNLLSGRGIESNFGFMVKSKRQGGETTLCSQNQLQNNSSKMVDNYRSVFGDDLQKVILFGSYARGDYDSESDIDYTAIVSGDRRTLQRMMKSIWDSSAELGLENDVIISPTVIPAAEFEKYRSILTYYRSIDKEGILGWMICFQRFQPFYYFS